MNFNDTCAYTENKFAQNIESRKYMLELKAFCNKVKPFVTYYDKLINSYNNEKLFAGKHNHSVFRILYAHYLGLHHYSINSPLYLRIVQDKYVALYRELITQHCTYVSAIRVLAKGNVPNTLMKHSKITRNSVRS